MKTVAQLKLGKGLVLVCLAGVLGLLATGCQTYQQENHTILSWRQGVLAGAVAEARTAADQNANNKDTVVWQLEAGAVLRAAGQYADSNEAFDRAESKIDDYAEKARVRVGQEAGALLSNQAELDYEGRSYDGIMLDTYKALNFLTMGQTDKARPELIRAYERQQDAVAQNKKRIQETQDAAAKTKDADTIDKAQKDSKFNGQMAGVTAGLDAVKSYEDYVNPFTVYLDGLYFLANATDGSDLERAHKSLERVVAFAPDNDFVKQDLAAVDSVMDGKPLAPTTYVIFETGCAPIRDQIRVDVPIIVSSVSYLGAAFPTLKFQEVYLPDLSVSTADTNLTTSLVAGMDGVVSLDFKNELPVVITKTVAATVTKAVAAYAINQAAEQGGGDIAGLFSKIATAGYQAAVNIADTRTWTTLPKQFQVARFPTPADRIVKLAGPGGMPAAQVTVGDGVINVVYVKSINPMAPLLISQFKLNGSVVPAAPPSSLVANPPDATTPPPANSSLAAPAIIMPRP